MFGIFKNKTQEELLEQQERQFNALLAAKESVWLQELNDVKEELRISQELEGFLNNQNGSLSRKLAEVTSLTFPENRFSHKKAIEAIMKLTPKSRVSFMHQLVQELSNQNLKSELESLSKYVNEKTI